MGRLLDQCQSTGSSRVPVSCIHKGKGKYPRIEEAVHNPGFPLLLGCSSFTHQVFREVIQPLHCAAALPHPCPRRIHICPFIVRGWCVGSCWTHTSPPLPPSSNAPFLYSRFTYPAHLPPTAVWLSPLVIHRVNLKHLSTRRGKCSTVKRLSWW